MSLPNANESDLGRRGGRNGLVAVAIDKDKASQQAVKWAIENLFTKGQTIIFIHVIQRSSTASGRNNYAITGLNKQVLDMPTKYLLLRFRWFCMRNDIECFDVVLEDTNIAKAITEFVAHNAIENLVLGASRHGFIRRLKTADVPTIVSQGSPNFCTVYVISKMKISSVRNASHLEAPFTSPLMPLIQQMRELQASQKEGKSVRTSEDLYELLDGFSRNMEARLEDIARRIGCEYDVSTAKKEVFETVGNIGGLTLQEKLVVSRMLVKNTEDMELFSSLPEDARAEFVQIMLAQRL